MSHEIVSSVREAAHWLVVCRCGKPFRAPNEKAAERRHAYHVQIENARAELAGTPERGTD